MTRLAPYSGRLGACLGVGMMRSEQGQSASAFVAVVALALFLVVGLVIDGGAQLTATARADDVAAAAVRVATDASASSQVDGQGVEAGRRAAEQYLASEPDVRGNVRVAGDTVTTTVRVETRTAFLSLIGIGHLTADATATGRLHS